LKLRSRLIVWTAIGAALVLPAGAASVQGVVQYQKIPATAHGLDLSHPRDVPVAQIRVELRDASNSSKVVAKGTTDDGGSYQFDVPDDTAEVALYVFAQTGKIQVGDPDTHQIYVVGTDAFDPSSPPGQVIIPDQDRLSGPFNILADIQRANRVLAQTDPTLPVGDTQLTIFWSPTNQDGTYFDVGSNTAWVLGNRDEDSDEFDDSVIIHEYGHYVAKRYSRDDTPGGEHYLGDVLDPRLAWSEGWANFFAQAVLGTPIWIDTMGTGGSDVFSFDLSQEVADGDRPGYWSEDSVGSALWSIFSDAGTGSGHLGLGLKPIFSVLHNYFPQQTFVYLLTLADGLVQSDHNLDSGITDVLARRNIQYHFGVVPPVSVPFPRLISPGAAVTGSVDSWTSQRDNLLSSADYYLLRKETDTPIDIELKVTGSSHAGAADLVLVLYNQKGYLVAAADQQHGIGSLEKLTGSQPAGTYVIGVWSFYPSRSGIRYGTAQYQLTASY
jgi:hypothetical protein